jgi:hypothetical protein
VTHGFVRSPDGSFTPVEAPGTTEPGSGTFAVSINDAGDMTGYYFIGTGTRHNFVRRPSGAFREFDAPRAGGAAYSGTFANSINDAGAVTGYYVDANSTNHGFLRTP